jgi:hypothetical protein
MQRRKYLQTTAVGLTAGLAGCDTPISNSTPTEAPTATPPETITETSTATEEPTPRENPPNVDPLLFLKVLPRKHLKEPSNDNPATAIFQRVDWKWYLSMRETPPDFGPASGEIWSFKPNTPNLEQAPDEDIFITPQWGAYLVAFNVEGIVGNFPALGPEMLRQCGLKADDGEREQARVVDEVVTYNTPNITMFIGADTDAVRDVLPDENAVEYEKADITGHSGVGDYSSRFIFVSDEQSRGVVAVETGDEKSSVQTPVLQRLAGRKSESIVQEPSVKWCLSELVPGPVVTGEINRGRYNFVGYGRSDRDLQPLEPFDTLMTSMDARKFTGTVQHVTSLTKPGAPTAAELESVFKTESGDWTTTEHPNVSSITGSW